LDSASSHFHWLFPDHCALVIVSFKFVCRGFHDACHGWRHVDAHPPPFILFPGRFKYIRLLSFDSLPGCFSHELWCPGRFAPQNSVLVSSLAPTSFFHPSAPSSEPFFLPFELCPLFLSIQIVSYDRFPLYTSRSLRPKSPVLFCSVFVVMKVPSGLLVFWCLFIFYSLKENIFYEANNLFSFS